MKLNLGCGDAHLVGYVGVDRRLDCNADIVCDVRELPLPNRTVEEIVAHDILEHFPSSETLNILREWRRVLVPGGLLELRVPNMHRLAREIVDHWGDDFVYTLIENIYGGHRWGPNGSWDAHHTGWTPVTLKMDLLATGFMVISQNDEANFVTVASRR